VEGNCLMSLFVILAVGVLLFVVDSSRTKPGDPL
jgi:hypothetical protein